MIKNHHVDLDEKFFQTKQDEFIQHKFNAGETELIHNEIQNAFYGIY